MEYADDAVVGEQFFVGLVGIDELGFGGGGAAFAPGVFSQLFVHGKFLVGQEDAYAGGEEPPADEEVDEQAREVEREQDVAGFKCAAYEEADEREKGSCDEDCESAEPGVEGCPEYFHVLSDFMGVWDFLVLAWVVTEGKLRGD